VTSLAGLSEEVIDPSNTAAISNSNRVSLTQALAYSKNDYFQQVGGQMGLGKMISYARQLGLGSRSGINVSGEAAGTVPSLRHSGAVNRVFSHGDGFKVTPLQLATLASVFATHGRVVVPFLPRNAIPAKASLRRTVNVDSKVWQTMTPGMVGAVNYGSGRKAFAPAMTVAGKTGTCIENGQWVGLFTSFAPLNNAQYAIAVIARGSDGRNHFPALVAGRIYRALNDRMAPLPGSQMASTSRDAEESASEAGDEIDEEESEEADDAEAVAPKANKNATDANQTIWGTERNAPGTRMRRVIMPVTKPRE
jgi:cell division protein FtsI/penicillin-binding protein 2